MDIFSKIKNKTPSWINLPVIFVLIYFVIASIYITYPLLLHMSDNISGLGDQLYINWILNWNIYSFTHDMANILNTNIFYPYHNTLAYSDIYITMSIISFLPTKIIGQPAVAYNFAVLFSFITLGFFTYLLCLYITKNHFASIAGGTLMAFSTYTLMEIEHLQIISMGWVSLSVLYFLKFLDKRSYKYLAFSCLFFVFQIYNSFLPAYFIVFSCLIITILYFLKRKISVKDINIKKIFLILGFTILISIPVIIPYYSVSNQFNYVRDIRESIRFANRPEYTFYPGDRTKLYSFLINTFYKDNKGPYLYDGYIGLAFLVLSLFSIINRIISKKKNWFLFDTFLIAAVFGFILSLGPALQWGGRVIKLPFIIPLPYALFYFIFPGFKGFRDSSRWEMLFIFTFVVCISIFLSNFYKNKSNLKIYLLTLLIIFTVLFEFNFPFVNFKIPLKEQFPKMYSYIKTLPKNAVIAQLPIYNWDTFLSGPYPENIREYYYTLTFPKTINGTAGFDPPPWQNNIRFLIVNFPNDSSISLLQKMSVQYLVVHKSEYDSIAGKKDIVDKKVFVNGDKIINALQLNKNLKLIHIVENDYVYKIN